MKIINIITFALLITLINCQKMERPTLGDYPKDANPPGGPLKFYTAFDGTTTDPLMNAVDSVMANFPSDNPLTSVDGVSGKAVQGETGKFIKYAKPNDWAAKSQSFTIATWFTGNAQTKNNKGTNGPEYFFSLKAVSGYHWSNASLLFFLEGSNSACAVKCMTVSADKKDNWFEWAGAQAISGVLDNNWHHIAIVYDASTSTATLYIDGVANANKKTWANHGNINFDDTKISEMRLGSGPNDGAASDDWLASTWKGKLDQFRLYGTALSAAEISALYSSKK